MIYLDRILTAVPVILMLLILIFGSGGLKLSGMGGSLETDHPALFVKILRVLANGYYISLIFSILIIVGMGGWKFDAVLFFIYIALVIWMGYLGLIAMRRKTMIHRLSLVPWKIPNFFLVTVPLYIFTALTMFELFTLPIVRHY